MKRVLPSAADLILWSVAVAMLVLVAFESLTPARSRVFDISDKLYHLISYLVLTFLFLLAAVWSPLRGRGSFPNAAWFVVSGAVAFGLLIEIIQGFTPPRQPNLLDAIANTGGACTALGVWSLLRLSATVPDPP